jgi:hypothetical protein
MHKVIGLMLLHPRYCPRSGPIPKGGGRTPIGRSVVLLSTKLSWPILKQQETGRRYTIHIVFKQRCAQSRRDLGVGIRWYRSCTGINDATTGAVGAP